MSADRDDNGRFAPGNPGGPGRPRRATEADYLAALSEAVPMERWREVCETAIDQAVSGDAKAREWLGSYLAGKPTGNALRRLAAAELEAAPAAPIEDPPTAGNVLDMALDMEASLTPEKRKALAALVRGQAVTDAARQAGVSPGTVRRWLLDDATFLAAHGAALSERDARPRAAMQALGPKAVAIMRDAMDGYAEPGAVRAAVEVVKLLKINEPAPCRATDPADAERQIIHRKDAEMMEDLLLPAPASWGKGDGDDEDDETDT